MITQKLIEIQKRVTGLQKNAKAFNYDYVNGDKVLSIIRPMMDELGILLIPQVDNIELTPISYSKWSRNAGQMVEETEVLTKLGMTMCWLDTEDETRLEVRWGSTGMNGFDKGYGSALTYGERYFLLKFFHIQTDRDDVDAVNTTRDKEKAETEAKKIVEAKRIADITRWADAEASGWVSKQGLTARESFSKNMNPTDEEMKFYLKEVKRLILEKQIKEVKK